MNPGIQECESSVPAADEQRLDAIDRSIILATQEGLPLSAAPWDVLAAQLDLDVGEILQRVRRMLESGVIRRIAAVPNHYALGYHANGMSVWNVPDDVVDELGAQVGALEFVSHCYRRPRHLPVWPYNLFAMVHGRSRAEVEERIAIIAALLDRYCRSHDVLYSRRILKKTGLRIGG
jgi:DNA-binding Lrp family transcriptional regulator